MFCKKCGTKLNDDALFCESCGTQIDSKKTDEPLEESIDTTKESKELNKLENNDVLESAKTENKNSEKTKKNNKIVFIVIAVILLGVAFMGINGSKASIVGKWEAEMAVVGGEALPAVDCYIDIKSDGTLYFQLTDAIQESGTWEYKEDDEEGTLYRVFLEDSGYCSIYEPKEPKIVGGEEVPFILVYGEITIGFTK